MCICLCLYAWNVCFSPGGEGALLGVPAAPVRVQSVDAASLQDDDDALSALEDKEPEPVTGESEGGAKSAN